MVQSRQLTISVLSVDKHPQIGHLDILQRGIDLRGRVAKSKWLPPKDMAEVPRGFGENMSKF